jgi:hypothetical protein
MAHLARSGCRYARRRWFAEALVSPVLTAHPTESAAQGILDCEREIARLMMWRDRSVLTTEEWSQWETGVYRQIVTLWQTAMLRLSRLRVRDEIENGLAYYRYTFLTEVPRLYEALAVELRRVFGVDIAIPPFLCMGSWIGGDRDGNPFVVAQTLEYAIARRRRSPSTITSTRFTSSARSASLSARLVQPTRSSCNWSLRARSNPHRRDECRQALTGVYARLAATRSPCPAERSAARRKPARNRMHRANFRPTSSDSRVAGHAWRGDPECAPPDAAHSRRRGLRLPSGVARPASERRRARGRLGRASRARRVAADYANCPRPIVSRLTHELDAATVVPAASRLRRAHALGLRSSKQRPTFTADTVRWPCRTT